MSRSWGIFLATCFMTMAGAYLLSPTPVPVSLSYSTSFCSTYPNYYPRDGLSICIIILALATAYVLQRLVPRPLLVLSGYSAGLHFKFGGLVVSAIIVITHAVRIAVQTCQQTVDNQSLGSIEAIVIVWSILASIAAYLLFDLRRYRVGR